MERVRMLAECRINDTTSEGTILLQRFYERIPIFCVTVVKLS